MTKSRRRDGTTLGRGLDQRTGQARFTNTPKGQAAPVIARDGTVRVSRRAVTDEDGDLYEGCHETDEGTVRCHAGIGERVGAIRVRSTGPVNDDTVALPWWWHEDRRRSVYRAHCYPEDSPHPFRKTRGPDGTYLKAPCTSEIWIDDETLDPFDNVVQAVCCNQRMSPKPKPKSKPKPKRRKRKRR